MAGVATAAMKAGSVAAPGYAPAEWTSFEPLTSASRACPATTSSRTTPRSTACGCTTSTRARAGPIVCFHGEPTWAYLYRKMLGPLVEAGYRVICPDYAGFGRSDKPTDRGWYTYDRHVELVTKLLAGLDLSDAIVVVQDWGGPIGLRWAIENARPRRRPGDPQHRALHRAGFEGLHGLAGLRREESRPAGRLRDPGRDDHGAAGRGRRRLRRALPDAESKAGAAQFPLLVPIEEEPMARRRCARWRTSSAAGRSRRWSRSPTATRSSRIREAGDRFIDWIPTVSEQVKIEGAAHFLQEDRGEQIAGEMLRAFA